MRALAVGALALAGVGVALGGAALLDRGDGDPAADGDRPLSTVVEGADPIESGEAPDGYRIVYRVETIGEGDDLTIATEEHYVRRPFDSTIVVRSGEPPGGGVLNTRASSLGRLVSVPETGDPLALVLPPAPAGSDLRPEVVLAVAAEAGRVELGEQREVAGRRCQVYRTGGPVATGDLTPYAPDGDERADICIDASGLLLEEVWWSDGDLMRRRVAVEVDEGAPAAASWPGVPDPEPISAEDGGGSAVDITDDDGLDRTAELWRLDEPPAGFELHGRWLVTPPELGLEADPGGPRQASRAIIATVWTRGPDLLVLEQVVSLGGPTPLEPHPLGQEVDVGDLGSGQLVADLRISDVRAATDDGYVRLAGTLEPARLVELARRLRLHPPLDGTTEDRGTDGPLADLEEGPRS